jgi:hypothetical protein
VPDAEKPSDAVGDARVATQLELFVVTFQLVGPVWKLDDALRNQPADDPSAAPAAVGNHGNASFEADIISVAMVVPSVRGSRFTTKDTALMPIIGSLGRTHFSHTCDKSLRW